METGLKKWLTGDAAPADFYELLGMPRLCSDRGTLLEAVRTAFHAYHPYQQHRDPQVKDRARHLQLRLADARRIIENPAMKEQYDGEIIAQLHAEFRDATEDQEDQSGPDDFRRWLIIVQKVDADRADELARTMPKPQSDDSSDSHEIALAPPTESLSLPPIPTDPELKQIELEILDDSREKKTVAEKPIQFPPRLPSSRQPSSRRSTTRGPSSRRSRRRQRTKPEPRPEPDTPPTGPATPPPLTRSKRQQSPMTPPELPPGPPLATESGGNTVVPIVIAALATVIALSAICIIAAWCAGVFDPSTPPTETKPTEATPTVSTATSTHSALIASVRHRTSRQIEPHDVRVGYSVISRCPRHFDSPTMAIQETC